MSHEIYISRCIELADGDYTAIYHADDVYLPEIVRAEADFLTLNPESIAY